MVATTASVVDAPNVIAQPKIQWRMSKTWTSALDVLQGSAERLAKMLVRRLMGGWDHVAESAYHRLVAS